MSSWPCRVWGACGGPQRWFLPIDVGPEHGDRTEVGSFSCGGAARREKTYHQHRDALTASQPAHRVTNQHGLSTAMDRPAEGPQGSRLLLLESLVEKQLGPEAGVISSLRGVLALPSGSLASHRAASPSPSPCNATIKWEGSWASLPALNPWGSLPGRTGPLGSFSSLPLRLCRAHWQQETGGRRSWRLGSTVEEAHWP